MEFRFTLWKLTAILLCFFVNRTEHNMFIIFNFEITFPILYYKIPFKYHTFVFNIYQGNIFITEFGKYRVISFILSQDYYNSLSNKVRTFVLGKPNPDLFYNSDIKFLRK